MVFCLDHSQRRLFSDKVKERGNTKTKRWKSLRQLHDDEIRLILCYQGFLESQLALPLLGLQTKGVLLRECVREEDESHVVNLMASYVCCVTFAFSMPLNVVLSFPSASQLMYNKVSYQRQCVIVVNLFCGWNFVRIKFRILVPSCCRPSEDPMTLTEHRLFDNVNANILLISLSGCSK